MTTDKWGFPLTPCRRCGGSGQHSFNTIHGSRCYGCGGSGWKVAKHAVKAYQAFKAHCQVLTRPTTGQLEVGDTVVCSDKKRRVIANLRFTDEQYGSYRSGSVRKDYFKIKVTFTDGTEVKADETLEWQRHNTVDQSTADEFLALVPESK
jgi:hypothetical protein